jgi:ribosomal protein S5
MLLRDRVQAVVKTAQTTRFRSRIVCGDRFCAVQEGGGQLEQPFLNQPE